MQEPDFIFAMMFGSTDVLKADDLGVDDEVMPLDPVGQFIKQSAFEKSGDPLTFDPTWDEPLTPVVAPVVKGTPVVCEKGTWGFHLGVTSVERVIIDGEPWIHAFDASGELVDARLVRE